MRGKPVRKTILYGAAGAILCAVGLLVWVLAATSDRDRWPSDGFGTLLWAVEGPTADGVGVAAMGIANLSPAGSTIVFLSSDLSVKGRRAQPVELGDVGETDGWPACCNAVGNLLGVAVSGYVVLSEEDLEALCAAVGPIELDVPATVSYRPASGDRGVVEIERGKQKLSGSEILAYVSGTSDKETAAEREERALRGILTAAQETELSEWPSPVRSSLGGSELLAAWRLLARKDAPLKAREVPTTVVVRDGVARRVAMAVETEKLVASSVRAKELLTAEDVSVVVLNGSGARLAATRAAEYLQDRGFRVFKVGNADSFGYSATIVLCLTDEAKAWILRDTLPGAARIQTPAEFGSRYEALRALVPAGTDLVLIVGAGMEFTK
jgi:hypothetical protein